ncbi:hypothetical protein FOCC_FOCC004032 [Frankliniella occidentalis]|nr:hypothetical protein FOCC_FOCC004032 [Frankliniella occidentalis]
MPVFQAPLSQIPNNYTVLQLLQARSDRSNTASLASFIGRTSAPIWPETQMCLVSNTFAILFQIKNSTKTTSLVHRNDLSPLSPNLAGNLNVSSEITNSICTRVLDCAKDLRSSDLAGNLLVFRGRFTRDPVV